MPISGAGQTKSFLDLQNEFGGSNPISMNEYGDKIGLTIGTTTTHDLDDFAGLSNITLNTWPLSGLQPAPINWGGESYSNASIAQVGCNYAQKHDTANNRLEHRWSTFNSGAPQTFTYAYQTYVGLGSATFEAKAVYSVSSSGFVGTVGNPTAGSPSSGTWTTVSTSSYSPIWQWTVTVSSGSGTRYLNGSATFYMRASLGGTYYPNSTGYDSGSKTISLNATRGTAGPAGPGGP